MPPTRTEGGLDHLDRPREVVPLRLDGRRDAVILSVDDVDDLETGEAIDLGGVGIPLFGEPGIERLLAGHPVLAVLLASRLEGC